MLFEDFVVYCLLFIVVFSFPGLREREKPRSFVKLFSLPVLFGVGMVILTALKVYFVYKFLVFLMVMLVALLSYWQWGKQIRRWWN